MRKATLTETIDFLMHADHTTLGLCLNAAFSRAEELGARQEDYQYIARQVHPNQVNSATTLAGAVRARYGR